MRDPLGKVAGNVSASPATAADQQRDQSHGPIAGEQGMSRTT